MRNSEKSTVFSLPPLTWPMVTLRQMIQVLDLPKPKVDSDLTWYAQSDYVNRAFEIMTGEKAGEIQYGHVLSYFLSYILPKIEDTFEVQHKTYEQKLIDHLLVAGKTYYLPNSVTINGEVILQHNGKAKRFIEASNLMKNWAKAKDYKNVPLFLSAYVMETQSERYDEYKIIKRGEDMLNVRMDQVYDIFFCISTITDKLKIDSERYIMAAVERKEKNLMWALRLGYLQLQGRAFILRCKLQVMRLFGKLPRR